MRRAGPPPAKVGVGGQEKASRPPLRPLVSQMIFSVFRKPARLRAWGLALFLTVWPWGLLQAEEAALNGQAVVAAPDSAVPAAEVGSLGGIEFRMDGEEAPMNELVTLWRGAFVTALGL